MVDRFTCPRIKKGISFRYDGKYSICCMLEEDAFMTDQDDPGSMLLTSKVSFGSFLESKWRQDLIDQEQAGTWPIQCKGCLEKELQGLQSYRLDVIAKDNKHLHVQTGNTCDSDCIMCGPMWSTKVMARLKQQPDPNKAYLGKLQVPVRSIWNDPSTLDNLREAAKWTDHIHFGGGEPLLDHRLWDFLESIVRSDLSISFVSNLNTLPTPRGFELLKSFKTAGINVSIDATGDLYGWMRHGLEYNTVMKNLAMTRSKQIDVAVNCEVQAHNVANMPAHWAEFKKIGVTTDYYFVDKPVLLRARNAPIYILKEAVDELPSDADEQLSHGLRQSIEYHDPEMSAKLINHTTYLNTHRKFTFDCDSWKVFLGK